MSDLTHTLELSTERMENIMNKVFILMDAYEGDVYSVHSTQAQAQVAMELLIEADKQHWFDTFGDYEGEFDNYCITEYEVN